MSEPVEITHVIRRMRGRSQAFLVRGGDGADYVCKFQGNPKGNRTLINEYIAGHLLTLLGVATPELTILRLDNKCEGRDKLYFSLAEKVPIADGLHLGSMCPVDAEKVAIFDFLPRKLSAQVANLTDIGVVLAFDQWVARTDIDPRQFIFARKENRMTPLPGVPGSASPFTAWVIDNGSCFGGDWTFMQQPPHARGVLGTPISHLQLSESAHRGARLIESLPAPAFQPAAYREIPREWFAAGDDAALKLMLGELQKRQDVVVNSILNHVNTLQPRKFKSAGALTPTLTLAPAALSESVLGSRLLPKPMSSRLIPLAPVAGQLNTDCLLNTDLGCFDSLYSPSSG